MALGRLGRQRGAGEGVVAGVGAGGVSLGMVSALRRLILGFDLKFRVEG